MPQYIANSAAIRASYRESPFSGCGADCQVDARQSNGQGCSA
jgi:hypothetical protein